VQIDYATRRQSLLRAHDRLRLRLQNIKQRSRQLSWARLWIFLGGVVLAFFTTSVSLEMGSLVCVISIVIFSLFVYQHRRIENSVRRFQIWLRLKEIHLARQAVAWEHLPKTLPFSPSRDHPYEIDLDVTGEYSLHRLLDTTATIGGSTRLREWLLTDVPDFSRIIYRQDLVRELVWQPIFRDKLTLYGKLSSRPGERWSAAELQRWLVTPIPQDRLGEIVAVLGVLALINLTLALLNAASLLPPVWLVPFLLYFALSISRVRDLLTLFHDAAALHGSLSQMKDVFNFLETYRYQPDRNLKKLCLPFQQTNRPSRLILRLTAVVSAASLQHNIILWGLLNALVPWDLFFAYQLRRCQRRLQTQLPVWLDTWYELEAVCALATFAYLNPHYRFPHIKSSSGVWQAQSMGHPLIPFGKRINNDFSIAGLGQIALVTGSNMSGKSTFLRTIGVNMTLAYIGSVVAAENLQLSLFRLFSCIRVTDSLADGFSYFYAEVRRLKVLLDALNDDHELPLFFLIDEIFRGTNNRERLIGSRAYIRALLGSESQPKPGIGLVATHDLELTHLASERILNYHFADRIHDGRMVFDYQLYTGPASTTNALRIMELEGLPVSTDEPRASE
jgi:hypothetical protein